MCRACRGLIFVRWAALTDGRKGLNYAESQGRERHEISFQVFVNSSDCTTPFPYNNILAKRITSKLNEIERIRSLKGCGLTRVDVGVLLHVGFLVESFTAVLTRIRPRVRVDEQVSRQRRRPLERLAALSAFEDFFRIVQRPISLG